MKVPGVGVPLAFLSHYGIDSRSQGEGHCHTMRCRAGSDHDV